MCDLTLALDRAAVNLPAFLDQLRERLHNWDSWSNDPLRIVPAPKSQRWELHNGLWMPVRGTEIDRLRPLAHVGLSEQVVATALMLCLADRIETLQGDPRLSIHNQTSRKSIVSYGNRLFCDETEREGEEGLHLQHRWGSAKLYRAYYEDYRAFLQRPEVAAATTPRAKGKNIYVVDTDLQQFYDRVDAGLLTEAIGHIQEDGDDARFFEFMTSVLNWAWDGRDKEFLEEYASKAELNNFSQVILPQGLVASGFFANIVLLAFDEALRARIGTEIDEKLLLVDFCRYVDDMRVVVATEPGSPTVANDVKESVRSLLDETLRDNARCLRLSFNKTQVATIEGDERPLLLQSAKMNRIQKAVSGGFDALGGEEILDAIQGLMRAQEAFNVDSDDSWRLSPVPDARDETVARFGARRYRTTVRSIRLLLPDIDRLERSDLERDEIWPEPNVRKTRSRRELDEEVRVFAHDLIRRWISDPSNVRLLRIGLDLWPDVKLLREVLGLLRPLAEETEAIFQMGVPKHVAKYCLAEILRAGATETALVPDRETLPSKIDLESYREELRAEAARLVSLPEETIPWYLRQQALLFIASYDPACVSVEDSDTEPETRHYWEMIQFLRGTGSRLQDSDLATLAVLARRAFVDRHRAIALTRRSLSSSQIQKLARRDPSFFLELIDTEPDAVLNNEISEGVREDLCLVTGSLNRDTLASTILKHHPHSSLRNELSILHFAKAFVKQSCGPEPLPQAITPEHVKLELQEVDGITQVKKLLILGSEADQSASLYAPPAWCKDSERWRLQLGYLLRFILSGQADFTRVVRRAHWKESESAYRRPESHWHQRLYGLYCGQPAFGDDWLPMTEWLEGFLLALLRWPGCHSTEKFEWVKDGAHETIKQIDQRIGDLSRLRGVASRTLILPLRTRLSPKIKHDRKLRACVVQTVIPTAKDINPTDLTITDSDIRQTHRRHLTAALAAVNRMLVLRETHRESRNVMDQGNGRKLDWLILPELAVHPHDVRDHLIPFARAHRAIILTGLTYEELFSGKPLVNSALWIIPEWSKAHGLQIKVRRQGKRHLAPNEMAFNRCGTELLKGFRPCQWLIGYPWSTKAEPLWLTAAVCYDATDLNLVADLRDKSDVLAIPALNLDVKTFDQMAMALHYHMYQLVIVANNGAYGGSNAYWPSSDRHLRQVFHTHGQPQAAISFFEIDRIGAFQERGAAPSRSVCTRYESGKDNLQANSNDSDWKHPPAGLGDSPHKAVSE